MVGMKRFISVALVASMLATTVPAWSDPLTVVAQTPVPSITPLQKAQPAPYTGVLLSPEAVAQVVAQKDTAAKALDLAIQHQIELDGAQLKLQVDEQNSTCTADKKVFQAQIDDGSKQIKILTDQLKNQSSGPGVPVWIGIGAAGGIVVTLAAVFAVSRATK